MIDLDGKASGHEVPVGQHLLGRVHNAAGQADRLQAHEQLMRAEPLGQEVDGVATRSEHFGAERVGVEMEDVDLLVALAQLQQLGVGAFAGQSQIGQPTSRAANSGPRRGGTPVLSQRPSAQRTWVGSEICGRAWRPVWRCTSTCWFSQK